MSSLSASKLFDLTGKVALVTGGGTGLGLTAALALASNGATVYISGRRKEKLDEAVSEYSNQVGSGKLIAYVPPLFPSSIAFFSSLCFDPLILPSFFPCYSVQGDVSSKEDLASIASTIEKGVGQLNILVNNAGVEGPMTKFDSSTISTVSASTLSSSHLSSESFADWDTLFRINTSSIFFSTFTFLPLLSSSSSPSFPSSIINITSISGIVKVSQNHYAYNASKAAANHLTQMLAHELRFRADVGVRVNAIAPGLFSSEMTSGGKSEKGKTSSEDVKGHENPAGRVGSEEEYAQVVLVLASNGFMTGQVVAVDGGFVTAVAANR
ncbi:short chain dehydrogenase/reductase [Pseudozyma hubeiensis SY62]|uniref:Short chain dehydrogenase/reductase n=1 Tax=Pseudozyma hubeiensis (strain SY62) TaxID=1305764 RepID=R9PA16_PSEHS|nr:short chain dehydrogenase/reductase [Pseudozyma hubeiensis SY62]GAC98223.1 short chain dehydrogenase/reductase [Pseudozyma hubeiensis SY62]